MSHQPVLLEEVLGYLQPFSGGRYLDATLGDGGHAAAILERSSPHGRLLGLDRDPEALARSAERLQIFGERVVLVQGSFADLGRHLDSTGWKELNGVVADLGLSSAQLADAGRGFSFVADGTLDMRFGPDSNLTAADLVNRISERDLADILFRYGEERRSRAIARRIVSRRPLATTAELRRAVHSVLGPHRRGGIDPATRTFQALRMAVNRELEALTEFLELAACALAPGGRLAIISYHSLEDREVKQTFRVRAGGSDPGYRILTAKPVRPNREEIVRNRRSRSAKLRVLEKVG